MSGGLSWAKSTPVPWAVHNANFIPLLHTPLVDCSRLHDFVFVKHVVPNLKNLHDFVNSDLKTNTKTNVANYQNNV